MLELIIGTVAVIWIVFTIVVMVAVLRVANEALPYYRRRNAEHQRQVQQEDRKAHPWAYE